MWRIYLRDPFGNGFITGPLSHSEAWNYRSRLWQKWPHMNYELRRA